jgi:DNA-binding response OmpR family regulator
MAALENYLKERRKILVVDSEFKMCELIALMLQESEFQVVAKQSFESFQSLINEEKPDLVIIDPSFKQWECKADFFKIFLEKMNKSELKFLLMGPPECERDYEELTVEGLVAYCVKPFSQKEFNLKIHNLMGEFGV